MGRPDALSIDEARRIALCAQGFGVRPSTTVTQRHLDRVLDSIGLIQIDSVNVLVRSQELPLFARLGEHRRDLIPRAQATGRIFEYWGHAASHIPAADHRLYRWRMDAARNGAMWGGISQFARDNRAFVHKVRAHVAENGPVVAGELSTRTEKKGTWWDWDDAKVALEYLFWTGEVTARRRDSDFARLYDLPERMIPAEHLNVPTPSVRDAQRELVQRAVTHLGVATATDIADYHHLKSAAVKPALDDLVESGDLRVVRVEGWDKVAYVSGRLRVPQSNHAAMTARALLSPFDSLVWCRPRVERLFGFSYRIEIYTPAPKRKFGYYVLPFLCDGEIVGRFDLKADRKSSRLLVQASHVEPTHRARAAEVAVAAADELRAMARWLGLDSVVVERRGSLASQLRGSIA